MNVKTKYPATLLFYFLPPLLIYLLRVPAATSNSFWARCAVLQSTRCYFVFVSCAAQPVSLTRHYFVSFFELYVAPSSSLLLPVYFKSAVSPYSNCRCYCFVGFVCPLSRPSPFSPFPTSRTRPSHKNRLSTSSSKPLLVKPAPALCWQTDYCKNFTIYICSKVAPSETQEFSRDQIKPRIFRHLESLEDLIQFHRSLPAYFIFSFLKNGQRTKKTRLKFFEFGK